MHVGIYLYSESYEARGEVYLGIYLAHRFPVFGKESWFFFRLFGSSAIKK